MQLTSGFAPGELVEYDPLQNRTESAPSVRRRAKARQQTMTSTRWEDQMWAEEEARAKVDAISDARWKAISQAYKLEHQLYQVENTALAEIRAELEVTRRSVLSVLATATKDWQISQAQGMLVEIERQIKAWAAFSTSAIGSRFPTVADIGVEQVTAALKAGGTSLSIGAGPMLSRDFIAVAYQSLPLMVTDISTEATTKIGRILRQSVLAQRTPLDAMHEIGTITGKGVFSSAFLRGETILRTEYGRICQTANYSALSDVAQDNPTLRKEWSAVIDKRTRPSHRAADGEIRDVDKPYDVGGNEALYPHDPSLPASESIACRCISVAQDASWPQDRTKSTQVPEGKPAPAAPAPPVVRLGNPFPTKPPHPETGYAEPVGRVTLKSGIEAKVSSYGDAVPGGYNGGFVAYDAATGAKMGYMEYESTSGGGSVLIAMNEVLPAYRGKGVSDALLMRLTAEFPGRPIDPGMMTDSGSSWWKRVKGYVPTP